MYKSVEEQSKTWANVAGDKDDAGHDYSYNWGDPLCDKAKNKQGEVLGNYKKILYDYVVPNIFYKTIVEIGSFDGKWTKFMDQFSKEITCVDIMDKGFDVIKAKIKRSELSEFVKFYRTSGDELYGIKSKSVDFIFSMDSLVRSEKEIILSYIKEFKRVLAENGKACIHLPCEEMHLSWEHGFTQINKDDISNMCKNSGIENFRIDTETINHGVLLLIGYE